MHEISGSQDWQSCCFALWHLPEESSVHSDSTVEAETNADIMPSLHKQPNLTLELFPNHSENLESAKKVNFDLRVCVCVWPVYFLTTS